MKIKLAILTLFFGLVFFLKADFFNTIESNQLKVPYNSSYPISSISADDTLDTTTATDGQLMTAAAITQHVETNIDTKTADYITATSTDTLENKSIDADNNTIANIGNDEIIAGVDAAKIGDGSISNTEFQYLDGVTGNIADLIAEKGTVSDSAFDTSWDSDTAVAASKNALYDKFFLLDEADSDKTFTGFAQWDGAGPYYSEAAGLFTLEQSGYGYIKDEKVEWTAPQTTTEAFGTYTINYIYIDSDGLINYTTSKTDSLSENNIVLFECYYTGTACTTVKENHPYSMPVKTSRYLHGVVGTVLGGTGATITRVTTGTGAATTDREVKIVGADILYDHGLETTIPDSGGSGVNWAFYYTNASGQWVKYSTDTEFPMVYNNAGTVTALGANKYGNFRCYVSKDDLNTSTPTYIAVIGAVEHGNSASAESAIANNTVAAISGPLEELEEAQLGYATVQNSGGGYIFSLTVEKQVLQSQISAKAGTTASGVSTVTTNFDNNLSAADATVQAALETLDDINIISTDDTADTDAVVIYDFSETGYKLLKSSSGTVGQVPTISADKTISFQTPPGAGGGEANTASNIGTGIGQFKQKNGIDLEFKRNDNTDGYIDITDGTDTVIYNISSVTGSDANIVTGTAGDANDYAIWNIDGDIIGGQPAGNSSGNLVTRSGANAVAADTISEITTDNGVDLDGVKAKDSFIELNEITTPTTPAANKLRIYAKDNGAGVSKFYYLDDAGNEVEVGAGGGVAVGHYSLSANQTTNLTVGNEVEYDTEDNVSSNAGFSFNSTTHQWTLTAGYEYVVTFSVSADFPDAQGLLNCGVYDTTTDIEINGRASAMNPNTSSNQSRASTQSVTISPTSNIIIEIRITVVNGSVSQIRGEQYTIMQVTEYQN